MGAGGKASLESGGGGEQTEGRSLLGLFESGFSDLENAGVETTKLS